MAEEIKETTQETEKEVSKTDLVKQNVQAIVKQVLGVKVSKDKAWELFKSIILGTVEQTFNVEGRSIPLSGVGTFEILETEPRGSKAGLDKEGNPIEGAKAWSCVPRFRFYPSSTINKLLEQKYGLADHGIAEKHYGIYRTEDAADTVEDTDAEDTADAPAETNVASADDDI